MVQAEVHRAGKREELKESMQRSKKTYLPYLGTYQKTWGEPASIPTPSRRPLHIAIWRCSDWRERVPVKGRRYSAAVTPGRYLPVSPDPTARDQSSAAWAGNSIWEQGSLSAPKRGRISSSYDRESSWRARLVVCVDNVMSCALPSIPMFRPSAFLNQSAPVDATVAPETGRSPPPPPPRLKGRGFLASLSATARFLSPQ